MGIARGGAGGSCCPGRAAERLTTAGVYTTLAARFLGPVLLALAALALRGRVKR